MAAGKGREPGMVKGNERSGGRWALWERDVMDTDVEREWGWVRGWGFIDG